MSYLFNRLRLKNAVVSFNTKSSQSERYDEQSSCGTRSRNTAENQSPEHAYIPSRIIRYLNSQCEHTRPITVEENMQSPENEATNEIVVTPRSSILSRMAKSKTSWVENQERNIPQRRSPIYCRGKSAKTDFTPFERKQFITDRAPKGFREGRKFDLLPISKHIAQNQQENIPETGKKLPLIRISSYQTLFVGSCNGACVCEREVITQTKRKTRATFFTKKDVFKPNGSREKPTVGQKHFINTEENSKQSIKSFIGLPVVQRKVCTVPKTSLRYDNRGVSFPVLV